jgi:hypothetical protein
MNDLLVVMLAPLCPAGRPVLESNSIIKVHLNALIGSARVPPIAGLSPRFQAITMEFGGGVGGTVLRLSGRDASGNTKFASRNIALRIS